MAGVPRYWIAKLSTISEHNQKAEEIDESTVDLISTAANAQNWIAKPAEGTSDREYWYCF